jgi:beta-1,2-mannobiose phosphorylase / 1,2-beta-oligomannan phosphorylase
MVETRRRKNIMEPDGLAFASRVAVRRVTDEPVIAAGAVPGYGPIFNAGALHHDGRFHLFARAVRDGYQRNTNEGPRFLDYISDVLVFVSNDGRSYEFQQVLAKASPAGVYSYEDPRVQRVHTADGERVVMSYTNLPPPETGLPWRVGAHRLGYENGRFFLNHTSGRLLGPESEPDKDAVIFNLTDGRVGLIHRLHPDMQLALFDSLDELWDPPRGYWDKHMRDLDRHTIISPSKNALGVGAGAPPVTTADGLILFFHERDCDGHYTTKVALLDPDTGQVESILPDPIMRPELPWERNGDVDNVVFVQGAILRPDGTIYLTYGAADRCVGAATVSTAQLVTALRAAA